MTATTPPARRDDRIALALIAAWSMAAFLSRTVGIWLAIGPTAIVLGVAAILLQHRQLAAIARPEPRPLLLGAAGGLAMAGATYVVFPLLADLAPSLIAETRGLILAFERPGVLAALVFLPLVVAGEEIVWRGVVYGWLDRRLSWPATVLVGTVLYALAHAPVGSSVLVLACLCAGVCWNLARFWTGSLAAVYVTHLIWDVIVLVVAPLVAVE